MNMESIRRQNEALIIRYLISNGAASRKTIAEETGLTPSSVTQITARFTERGFLTETGQSITHRVGRREILLSVDPLWRLVLTINIEPDYTTLAVSDLTGTALAKQVYATGDADAHMGGTAAAAEADAGSHAASALTEMDRSAENAAGTEQEAGGQTDPAGFLNFLGEKAQEMLSAPEFKGIPLLGVSVGITGDVDRRTGTSRMAYGIWQEPVPVAEILGRFFSVPVMVENNVNAFAAAELLFGAGRTYRDLMLIKWGPGVGSTIITDGRIYEGRHGRAAELGHVIAEPGGKRCRCGKRGCLETIVSEEALGQDGAHIRTAGAYSHAVDVLAREIVNAMTLLAPHRVILYGPLLISADVREDLIHACMQYDPGLQQERFLFSALSDREDYIGPAAVCIGRLIEDPSAFLL